MIVSVVYMFDPFSIRIKANARIRYDKKCENSQQAWTLGDM